MCFPSFPLPNNLLSFLFFLLFFSLISFLFTNRNGSSLRGRAVSCCSGIQKSRRRTSGGKIFYAEITSYARRIPDPTSGGAAAVPPHPPARRRVAPDTDGRHRRQAPAPAEGQIISYIAWLFSKENSVRENKAERLPFCLHYTSSRTRLQWSVSLFQTKSGEFPHGRTHRTPPGGSARRGPVAVRRGCRREMSERMTRNWNEQGLQASTQSAVRFSTAIIPSSGLQCKLIFRQ